MPKLNPLTLAELWVDTYGDTAPYRIREWAIQNEPEAQIFLRRVAQIADNLIAMRR
jgi:hypothetical protein